MKGGCCETPRPALMSGVAGLDRSGDGTGGDDSGATSYFSCISQGKRWKSIAREQRPNWGQALRSSQRGRDWEQL